MKSILLFLSILILNATAFAQKNYYLVVGTYTGGRSEGIYVYRFHTATGDVDSVSMIKSVNPSYLTVSANEKFVYAVNELSKSGNGGGVSAYSFNRTDGHLHFLDQQESKGDDPCYISIDKSGKWAAVANYTSGSLSIFPLAPDGSIQAATTTIKHSGHGVDKERQEGPHVHCTIFSGDNKYLFATDLGLDKITIYSFNELDGKLQKATPGFVATKPGTGPRHLTFHPNQRYAYLIEEMKGIVSAYRYSNGRLQWIQDISSMPPHYKGPMGSADIHVSPDGKFLYASNRDSSNTIAIFKVNEQTGKLTIAGYQSTLGRTPRNFNFDPTGNFLLVGDQSDDYIVVFKVNRSTGLLTDTGKRIQVGKPVCLKWISAP